ncbi:MAG: flagellar hook-associated protein FlgK [Desulfuromonadaceae bacterium]|nr:flagellar hook-associated protein FlgK [Desulfuromonadaceae bacterium]
MSGINSIFNTASTSLVAQRVAMDVTGENIANVNTPGYSRQRAIMETAPVTNSNGFPLGNGVLVKSVQRFYDAVLQKNIADGNSSLQNNQSRLISLQSIEPSFNDVSTDGLGKSIQDFFDSWQALSVNASGAPERQAVLSKAQVMIDNFHQVNQSLRDVQNNANRTLDGITAEITLKAKSIASLNDQINQTELVGASSSELRDQRDYLAQELSKKVGASFTEERNGTLTVRLADGSTLVDGNRYATVYTSPLPLNPPDPNNVTPSNHILVTSIGNPPPDNKPAADSDITGTIGGARNSQGEIGAMLGMRDTAIPDYLQKLDELAYNLANQVNTQHKQGWNLNNTVGDNFFTITSTPNTITIPDTTLLSKGDAVYGQGIPYGTRIASIDSRTQITLTPPLIQSIVSGTTFTFPSGDQRGKATGVSGYSSSDASIGIGLNITSLNEIAAADTNPLNGGSGNNSNAMALAAIKDQQFPFATVGGANSSVISYYNAMVSGIGVDVRAAQNASDQGESYVAQLHNLRESNSGVSLDEEMTNMIKYQKAFEGAAKMMNTAMEMMDTVLGMVR